MSKFSVKKPFTVLVAVLTVLILGIVSLNKMQLDLLPEMSLPYLLVITTYPGASPEKVEATVSKPMESGLGTINGVKNVYSFSNENYSLVELEFEDGTDMDSVLVKVSSALDNLRGYLPEECGVPNIMEISMDMMATMYTAISYDGKDSEELSRFVEDTLNPQLERLNGVASISTIGLVTKTVSVDLDQKKVDALNEKILAKANDAFDEAKEQLDDAKKKLEDGQKELNDGKAELNKGQKELTDAKNELESSKTDLEKEEKDTYDKLASAAEALDQLATHQATLLNQKAQETALKTAIEKLEPVVESAPTTKAALNTGITLLETYVDVTDNNPASLKTDASVPPQPLLLVNPAAYSGVIGMLTTAQIDSAVTDALNASKDAYDTAIANADYTEAVTQTYVMAGILAKVLDGFSTGLEQIELAEDSLPKYQSELTALQLEIQVTNGIIGGYESELKKLGVNYKDIEKAKLEAAAGFGSGKAQIAAGEATLESAQKQIDASKDSLKAAQDQIDDGWKSYEDGLKEFEKQKEIALKSANADKLLTLDTLAGIIYAQNFAMPAGYIDDKDDNSWLLKVGENYDSVEDLGNMVLVEMDGIGKVRLSDVANLTVIDDADASYAKLDNSSAVILSIFKASTSGTNEVSKTLKAAITDLEEKYNGLHIMIMMDQGDYIRMIVKSVLQSMVLGASLAIIILAIFLKDVMPTIVVAISIPLSVFTSLVAMYFAGISLNMMSLSGMALGIGMLVDNSIVVIENIYRLRGRGMSAPRAAVQGTKQVAGAVIASTLTSVCVFFPMVYTTGMVRELMLPMSLTIIFCLMASLLVAMTVVPAASSTLLRNTKVKERPLFEKIQNVYGKTLSWCLKVKAVPLALAIGLLALTTWQVIRMGIVMIPEMTSNQIQGSITFDEEETTKEEAYALVDKLIYDASIVEGVDSVGVMMGGSTAIVAQAPNDSYESFTFMVTTKEGYDGANAVKKICKEIEGYADDFGMDVTISTGMDEMSEMLGSGLSIKIFGQDTGKLVAISEDLMEIVDSVEGFTNISNGEEEAGDVLHLYIDRDYAMSKGLTTAQIYQAIAGRMTTSKDAITVTIDGVDMAVTINDNLDPLTRENLLDMTFEVTEKNEDDEDITVDKSLKDFARVEKEKGVSRIRRENLTRSITVTADVMEGYNTTLLTRELEPLIEKYNCPDGYTISTGGESETVMIMVKQMGLIILLGVAFIYFVMVAQFQSLLSPFIVLFTLPLAFTGGLLALWLTGENISMMSLMGFVVLIGTVVNNGIVYVDYTNQLRTGGMERRDALIATGKTRMRPILMTALTTILAESSLIFGDDMGAQMGRGMALVIAGGLLYATLMTLYIIPVMYDILFKRKPLNVDIGNDDIDDVVDDAKEFLEQMQ